MQWSFKVSLFCVGDKRVTLVRCKGKERKTKKRSKPIENIVLCFHRTTTINVSNDNANTDQGLSSVLQASIRHVIANNFKNHFIFRPIRTCIVPQLIYELYSVVKEERH